MIYTRIQGGLGNQLFQYCSARVLADHLGVELGLDVRGYKQSSPFGMGLKHFNLRADYAPAGLPKSRENGIIPFLISTAFGRQGTTYREARLGYDEGLWLQKDDIFLKGYWQSEKYFRACKTVIANDLKIITPPSDENKKALETINNCLAVSLHIRRGDYVTNAKYNAVHGTCDIDYYQRAVEYLAQALKDEPVIYAFSDDPDWVEEHLKLPFEIRFMRHNSSEKNYEDLRLMSACKHHIIANSSFSWWGAWLNPNNDKTVIAPENWYADAKTSNPDILPPEWITV